MPQARIVLVCAGLGAANVSYLQRFFRPPNWEVKSFEFRREAEAYLSADPGAGIVLSACDFPDGDWRMLLAGVSGRTRPPLIIVAAENPDDLLWAEILNGGAYDLLPLPFHGDELFRVVGLAWHSWIRRIPRAADMAVPGGFLQRVQ